MIVISIFSLFKIDEFFSALVLNFLFSIFFVFYLIPKEQRLIVSIGLIFTPYILSALLGFSTFAFAVSYCLCLHQLNKKHTHFYLTILLLCLIRPDGVIWGFGLVITRLIEKFQSHELHVEIKAGVCCLILPGITYFILRAWYFAELLPLPFLVKASGDRDAGLFWQDSLQSLKHACLPILLVGLISTNKRYFYKKVVLFFLVPFVFYASMRLEQNIGNRFLAPFFFSACYLIARNENKKVLAIFVIASIWIAANVTEDTFRKLALSKNESVYYISNDMAQLKGSLLTTEAGRLTYYSDWDAQDAWGLNTPAFAKKLISRNDIKSDKFNLIVAHCDLTLLKQDNIPKYNPNRSWENLCVEMVSGIKNQDYTVYYVPFLQPTSSSLLITKDCYRHDIYAISNKYTDQKKLANILEKYGAMKFSEFDGKIIDKWWICKE
ncbi:MAG: hypothetical protein V4629_01400 [Pseudomonadota bacterium]